MQVNEQQIIGVSQELWSSSLGLSLALEDGLPDPGEPTRASCMKATGAWTGALLVECPESVLRHAALMLFDQESDAVAATDMDDALTELAEMIGRKLRDVLPEKTKFSKPAVVDDESQAKLPGEIASRREISLSCEGRPMRFVVIESSPPPTV